ELPVRLPENGATYKQLVEDYERRLIRTALRRTGGVQKRAAELLKIKPTTLHEIIKRLEIREQENGLRRQEVGGGVGGSPSIHVPSSVAPHRLDRSRREKSPERSEGGGSHRGSRNERRDQALGRAFFGEPSAGAAQIPSEWRRRSGGEPPDHHQRPVVRVG